MGVDSGLRLDMFARHEFVNSIKRFNEPTSVEPAVVTTLFPQQ